MRTESNRREYMREYHQKHYALNKESIYLRNRQWVLANWEKRRAYNREYMRTRRKNKEISAKEALSHKKWIANNPEKRREIMRKARAKWLEANREFDRLLRRRRQKDNPEIWRIRQHRRRERVRNAKPCDKAGANVLCQLISDAPKLKCGICGKNMPKNDRTIDHVIPLSKGGSGEIWNLRIVHLKCNLKKSHKMPDELKFNVEPKVATTP